MYKFLDSSYFVEIIILRWDCDFQIICLYNLDPFTLSLENPMKIYNLSKRCL